MRTRRSGETPAEEDVAYVAVRRPKVGEWERSPRLWQRSGTGTTCAWVGLGRVAQGLASSTGREGGSEGEVRERESLTEMYTKCNHGDRLSTRLLRYYGNKPPLHQSRHYILLLRLVEVSTRTREQQISETTHK